jgi:hypothetical protein
MRPLPFLPGFWKLVGTFRDNLFEKAQRIWKVALARRLLDDDRRSWRPILP